MTKENNIKNNMQRIGEAAYFAQAYNTRQKSIFLRYAGLCAKSGDTDIPQCNADFGKYPKHRQFNANHFLHTTPERGVVGQTNLV